jgi:hypothetical protein
MEWLNKIFNTLWFNLFMAILSITALIKHLYNNYTSGDYYQNWIFIIVWAVLVFYFIRASLKRIKTD